MSAPFDLLNVEDLDVITQARAACEQLVLGVWSDELVERAYGRPPVVGLDERMALLRRVRGIEEVLVHDDVDASRFAETTVITETTATESTEPAGSGAGSIHRVFAVADRPEDGLPAGWPAEHTVWLRVGRRTGSAALQRALAPATDGRADLEDVAVA